MGVRQKRRAAAARGPPAVRGWSQNRPQRGTARRFGVFRDGEPRRLARRLGDWVRSVRARAEFNWRRTRRAIYGDLLGEAVCWRTPHRWRLEPPGDAVRVEGGSFGLARLDHAAQNLPLRTRARDVLGRNSRTMMSSSVNRVAKRGGFTGSTRQLASSAGAGGCGVITSVYRCGYEGKARKVVPTTPPNRSVSSANEY